MVEVSAAKVLEESNDARDAYDRTSYILIVDDDDTLLKFFKIHLNKFFSKVLVARNAKEAGDYLKDREIDLVITDIHMPRVDGRQLLKRVRKAHQSVPVLLISGALFDVATEKEIRTDADGYLRKPFSIEELNSYIHAGIDLCEQYKLLKELIPQKLQKSLYPFLNADIAPEDLFKDEVKRTEAVTIREKIHRLWKHTKG